MTAPKDPGRITSKEFIVRGFSLGTEFALTVIAFLFLGFYLGDLVGGLGRVLLMILGATAGFTLGMYRLVKKATNIKR